MWKSISKEDGFRFVNVISDVCVGPKIGGFGVTLGRVRGGGCLHFYMKSKTKKVTGKGGFCGRDLSPSFLFFVLPPFRHSTRHDDWKMDMLNVGQPTGTYIDIIIL